MQRPLTPTFAMFGLQVWPKKTKACRSERHAKARFLLAGYLQYTMYAKLLLKAIPSHLIPAVYLPASNEYVLI
jgi:hypothetical protein